MNNFNLKKGLFITFEGVDGCGKSTQVQLVRQWLGDMAYYTREPGGCAISEAIRAVVLNPVYEEMHPLTEMLLYASARAQHVQQVIRPALEAGMVVICDRFVHSSVAYQGYGRGLGAARVWQANESALDGLMPDLTVWIDVTAESALERQRLRDLEPDRLEKEGLAFQKRLYEGFEEMSMDSRWARVSGEGTVEEVFEAVRGVMGALLKRNGFIPIG